MLVHITNQPGGAGLTIALIGPVLASMVAVGIAIWNNSKDKQRRLADRKHDQDQRDADRKHDQDQRQEDRRRDAELREDERRRAMEQRAIIERGRVNAEARKVVVTVDGSGKIWLTNASSEPVLDVRLIKGYGRIGPALCEEWTPWNENLGTQIAAVVLPGQARDFAGGWKRLASGPLPPGQVARFGVVEWFDSVGNHWERDGGAEPGFLGRPDITHDSDWLVDRDGESASTADDPIGSA